MRKGKEGPRVFKNCVKGERTCLQTTIDRTSLGGFSGAILGISLLCRRTRSTTSSSGKIMYFNRIRADLYLWW